MYGIILGSKGNIDTPTIDTDYLTYEEMHDDYEKGILEHDDNLVFEGIKTTYGRLRLSRIIHADIDVVIGYYTPISPTNMITIIRKFSIFNDRLDIYKKLQDFSMEMLRVFGVTSLNINEIYFDVDNVKLKTDIDAINNDSSLEDTTKLLRCTELYQKFVADAIKSISPKVREIIDSSDRIKISQLVDINVPNLTISNGKAIINTGSLYSGVPYDEYANNHSTTNRDILSVKKEAVPSAGYLSRQLNTLGQSVNFLNEYIDIDDNYLELPEYLVTGRINIDGEVIKGDSTNLVKVPSFVFNKENTIYKNQINTAFNQYNNDQLGIGSSFSGSSTESITQAGLGLKHGGTFRDIHKDSKLVAREDGKIINKYINSIEVFTASGSIDVYPITNNFVINLMEFKKGETIGFSNKLVTPTYILDRILKLLSAYSSSKSRNVNKNLGMSVSVAPYSGKITYEYTAQSIIIKINGTYIDAIRNDSYTTLYYPANYEINKYDVISSDLLNVNKYIKSLDSQGNELVRETYMAFRSQFKLLRPQMTEDLIEFIFRILIDSASLNYLGVKNSIKNLPFLTRIAFGYSTNHLNNINQEEDLITEDSDMFTEFLFRDLLNKF